MGGWVCQSVSDQGGYGAARAAKKTVISLLSMTSIAAYI